jgi:hypothetical protein
MDDIDYTRYLYKKSGRENVVKEKKHRPHSVKRIVVSVIAVILCFAIVLLCADFFGKGKIFDKLSSYFKNTEYDYYFVAASFPTRETAYAVSVAAVQSGGGGYLFTDGNAYIVAYSAYTELSDAESVAAKNSSSSFFVYTLSYKTSDTDFANAIDSFARDIASCCVSLENGSLTESDLNAVIDNYSKLFSAFDDLNESETHLASFIVSALSSIQIGITQRTELLFRLRHSVCSVLVSARETFST